MKKVCALIFMLLLIFSAVLGISSVKASSITVDVRPGYQTALVNETVQFVATTSGGSPPYTYQWYTQLWTTWEPGMSYPLPPLGSEVAAKGATSSTFNFSASKAGTYGISIRVKDSLGNSVYNVFNPGGIWVFVKESTSSPSPTANITLPELVLVSPENKTYPTKDIQLNFSISKPANWIGYSIDKQANVTINGNVTLTELSYGSHSLTIYANDSEGNDAIPQNVTFNANQEPTPFPTTEVIAITTTALISVAGGLVFFLKRKHLS
jgi:hypothetical protein